MKKYLNKQWVFNIMLCILSFIAKIKIFAPIAGFLSSVFAKLNLAMSKTSHLTTPKELAEKWKELMPIDKQYRYKVISSDDITAITEIHIHCPLRNSKNVNACYELMNYDRTLVDHVGGQLIVLDSQSNSDKKFCTLAIRKKGAAIDDLTPAHLK